jgi:hypothetical protein
MLEENGSKQLPELPDPASKKTETSSDIPQVPADFRRVPKDAEELGTVPQAAERRENHTLTVRETSRRFEAAGVARTERSIINWCQPNRQGVARLDGYFDPNDRRYYITPESVELAVAEEKARAAKNNEPDETVGRVRNTVDDAPETNADRVQELERENLDLKIANRGRDYFIGQLQNERNDFFKQLLDANRRVGELETRLQIEGPENNPPKDAEHQQGPSKHKEITSGLI